MSSPQFGDTGGQRTSRTTAPVWAVVMLGLASYLVSYGVAPPPSSIGWGVRFSALAAIVAALGLFRRHSARTQPMVTLAVMGLLEALSQNLAGEQTRNWATIVIVVLTALQALAAIAALAVARGPHGTAAVAPAPYDTYAYYAQIAQQYYATTNQQPPHQQPVHGHATAHATAASSAQTQQPGAESYALYTQYLDAHQPAANAAAPPAGTPAHAAQSSVDTGMPATGPTEMIRPTTDLTTGRPAQSP
jgi:hypothetical protein